jgi:hypothetical protein
MHGAHPGPHCGDCRDHNCQPSPDAIKFEAVLQHIPLDITSRYNGGIILDNLTGHMEKADLIRLSTLACESRNVRITLEVL